MAVDPKLFEVLLSVPAMLDELTEQVRTSADALQEQVERIRALMAALNPSAPAEPEPPRQKTLREGLLEQFEPREARAHTPPPLAPPPPTQLRLSPGERAQREALLGQFDPKAKMREEIEREIEGGA